MADARISISKGAYKRALDREQRNHYIALQTLRNAVVADLARLAEEGGGLSPHAQQGPIMLALRDADEARDRVEHLENLTQ